MLHLMKTVDDEKRDPCLAWAFAQATLCRVQLPYAPTIILLIGMWINFTKNPMNPMTRKPTIVAVPILANSFISGFVHRCTSRFESWTQ